MKKLLITLAILALTTSAQATDLLSSQTTNVAAGATELEWSGGTGTLIIEGTFHGAKVGIIVQADAAGEWVKVVDTVGHQHLFEDGKPQTLTFFFPNGYKIKGYLENAGSSTSITLRAD